MAQSAASAKVREDTSRYSYYVDPSFYEWLIADLAAWDDAVPADPAVRAQCEALLFEEARLIDDGRFEDWLDLFTKDCLYWIPSTPGGGDPRREVSIAFDDRRRLEDRIYWLRTGYAYSQIPPSRTRRLITNIEVLRGGQSDEVRVRSNFVIFEFRNGRARSLAGWYAHLLRREAERWRIVVKRINLIDSEHGHENMTLVF
jgi:benzoate/toluate 1,2-dioxygenase beta subunit